MAVLKVVVTAAGRAALVNAQKNGTNAVKLTTIQFGSGKYAPSETQTALQSPFKTLSLLTGGAVGDSVIHVEGRDDSTEAYTIYEFGVFTSDGTLFAVYSSTTPVAQKAADSVVFLAIDMKVDGASASTVTVGDTNFLLPSSTTELPGVIELATNTEVLEGTDSSRAVTPKTLADRMATESRTGLVELATSDETQDGTDTSRAVTPKALADRTATESRTGILALATSAEVAAGTDAVKAVTAKTVAENFFSVKGGAVSGSITASNSITAKGGFIGDLVGNVTGNLTGNADTATTSVSATSAANDRNGNDIAKTYMPYAGGTFTGIVNFNVGSRVIHTSVVKGTAPSTADYREWIFLDSQGTATANRLGAVGHVLDASGTSKTFFSVYAPVAGATDGNSIWIQATSAGAYSAGVSTSWTVSGYNYCSTPASSDNSTKSATTAWVRTYLDAVLPIGAILPYFGSSVPDGFLLCNGAAVSRTTYAKLFAVLGTKCGAGDGSTTFNLPDTNGRFLEGTTTWSEVGTTVEAGLPNIIAIWQSTNSVASLESISGSGAFSTWGGTGLAMPIGSGDSGKAYGYRIDASRYDSRYTNSKIQPASRKSAWIIRY